MSDELRDARGERRETRSEKRSRNDFRLQVAECKLQIVGTEVLQVLKLELVLALVARYERREARGGVGTISDIRLQIADFKLQIGPAADDGVRATSYGLRPRGRGKSQITSTKSQTNLNLPMSQAGSPRLVTSCGLRVARGEKR
jgi:hypothetical protein